MSSSINSLIYFKKFDFRHVQSTIKNSKTEVSYTLTNRFLRYWDRESLIKNQAYSTIEAVFIIDMQGAFCFWLFWVSESSQLPDILRACSSSLALPYQKSAAINYSCLVVGVKRARYAPALCRQSAFLHSFVLNFCHPEFISGVIFIAKLILTRCN